MPCRTTNVQTARGVGKVPLISTQNIKDYKHLRLRFISYDTLLLQL